MNENATCPIWGTPTNPTDFYRGDGLYVDSPRAGGKYFVDGRAGIMVGDLEVRAKARLTTWLIEQRALGIERPEIWSYNIDSIVDRAELSHDARADELLKYIQKVTPYPGQEFVFRASGYSMEMLAHTESVDSKELLWLLNALIEKNWLELTRASIGSRRVTITPDGYTYLASLADLESVNVASSQVFIAMWFHTSLDDALNNGIRPAIKDAGYNALRIDDLEHLDKVDDRIIEEIERSRFVVADFTQEKCGARGGVYYEAGFARGRDIPVIPTCRHDAIGLVHFNTRQYNHVVWEDPEQLRVKLTKSIVENFGYGPLKTDDDMDTASG